MRQKLNVALLHHFVKVGGETQLSVAAQRQPPPTHRTPHASNHPSTHAPTLSFRPQRSVAEESAFPSSTENPSCKAQAQADEIPRRPKGSVGMTNGGGGCAGREPNFVGRIVGRIVGRSNPFTYKRMRFLVARRALSE